MIYEVIKAAAKDKGMSINSLEKEINVAPGCICKWNNHKPSFDKIVLVSKILEIPLEKLADGLS